MKENINPDMAIRKGEERQGWKVSSLRGADSRDARCMDGTAILLFKGKDRGRMGK